MIKTPDAKEKTHLVVYVEVQDDPSVIREMTGDEIRKAIEEKRFYKDEIIIEGKIIKSESNTTFDFTKL